MNTILTDDERRAAIKSVRYGMFTDPEPDQVARAVEAAVLTKLARQEPVAWHTEDHLTDRSATTYSKEAMHRWRGKGWPVTPLYTHPAPQQTVRRGVSDGWKLVPVEPTPEMWAAVNKLDDQCAAGNYDGKGCSIEQAWYCLLAAAPEAPAQASAVEKKSAAEEYERTLWFAGR